MNGLCCVRESCHSNKCLEDTKEEIQNRKEKKKAKLCKCENVTGRATKENEGFSSNGVGAAGFS